MKKILTILLILLLSQVCFAGRLQEMQKAVVAAKNGASTVFCAGTELFCNDFDGTDPTWTLVGTTYDCNLDTAADYCDDVTIPVLDGSECYACNGSASNRVIEDLSTTSGEFTFRFKMRTTVSRSSFLIAFNNGTTELVKVATTTGSLIRIYYNGSAANVAAATGTISIDTNYNIIVYFKKETDDGNDDGVIKVKLNGTEIINSTGLNTRVTDASEIRLLCGGVGITIFMDSVKVEAGDTY